MAARRVFVVGVGMTKFEKPGRREDFDYPDMVRESVTKALQDAGLPYSVVEQAAVGYVYGDTTCGQRALYEMGMTGIPIYNVNNACSTGSTALMMAKQLVEGALFHTQAQHSPTVTRANDSRSEYNGRTVVIPGLADCVLAVGFEKMESGSLSSKFGDRTSPVDKHVQMMIDTRGIESSPLMPQMFANAGREHMEKYGTKPIHFAKVAHKNHKHSINNPNSQFRDEYTLDQILQSKEIHPPLTKLQCSPTSDGSAAALVCSENFVRRHGLEPQAVEIVAQEMRTDFPSTFADSSCIKMVGYDLSKSAADAVFKKSGYTRDDVDVVELHDCFSTNELITYEALGLCPEGKASEMIDRGDNTYGGKYVINPSGGLISKGHPLGATGLAQCTELCWQLRGLAGKRQVPGAKVALQHNLGLGGACVITLYKLGFPSGEYTRKLSTVPVAGGKMRSDEIFEEIRKTVEAEGEVLVKKVKGVFLFKITASGGRENQWIVDLKNGKGSVKNTPGKGDVTIKLKDDDFMDMVAGKLTPQKAFFSGKLKLAGNTALAMKLQNIIPRPEGSKL